MDDCPEPGSFEDDNTDAGGNSREDRRAELRAAVQRGLDDIKAGRVVDLDEAFDRIDAMLDELEARKRPGA